MISNRNDIFRFLIIWSCLFIFWGVIIIWIASYQNLCHALYLTLYFSKYSGVTIIWNSTRSMPWDVPINWNMSSNWHQRVPSYWYWAIKSIGTLELYVFLWMISYRASRLVSVVQFWAHECCFHSLPEDVAPVVELEVPFVCWYFEVLHCQPSTPARDAIPLEAAWDPLGTTILTNCSMTRPAFLMGMEFP